MPLARRIPKRGFNNISQSPLPRSTSRTERFEDGAVVDAAALIEKGILHDCKYGLKILANGKLTKKLTVKAAAFSESAKAKMKRQAERLRWCKCLLHCVTPGKLRISAKRFFSR
jgi:large subunit ribosomal protein L15